MMWFLRKARSLLTRKPVYRIGWSTFESFLFSKMRVSQLRSFSRIRAGNIRGWINANDPAYYNEIYHPERRYDLVVFHKIMDARCQQELQRIQNYGGKVIFDANVNYYEIWGDYFIEETQPTEEQQRDVIWMTCHADWVVADSSYVADIARKFAPNVTWIPDNVNLDLYRGIKEHHAKKPVVLVWSGISTKAYHLLDIQDVLAELKNVELFLVSEKEPDILADLNQHIPCRFVRFSDTRYAEALLESDIIISPKRLCNGYALGHSEYKITLGMAVGLPAVASPQQSYIDAISHLQGGIIARSDNDWKDALNRLVNDFQLRKEMGARARQTVLEKYSTPVVSKQYLEVFKQVLHHKNENLGEKREYGDS